MLNIRLYWGTTMKKHILIVDDDPSIRSLLKRNLEKSYKCSEAVNGVEALSLLSESNSFDLVITDIQMPVMSGIKLIEEMDKRSIKKPVCVISGSIDDSIITKLDNLGCSDFLEKPFMPNELFQKVDNTLSRCSKSAS